MDLAIELYYKVYTSRISFSAYSKWNWKYKIFQQIIITKIINNIVYDVDLFSAFFFILMISYLSVTSNVHISISPIYTLNEHPMKWKSLINNTDVFRGCDDNFFIIITIFIAFILGNVLYVRFMLYNNELRKIDCAGCVTMYNDRKFSFDYNFNSTLRLIYNM